MNNDLQSIIAQWNKLSFSDRYLFSKNVQIADGHNIILGTSTGTTLGTNANQKVGFYGKAIVQNGAFSHATSPGATYSQSDASDAVNKLNSIIDFLHNIGLTA